MLVDGNGTSSPTIRKATHFERILHITLLSSKYQVSAERMFEIFEIIFDIERFHIANYGTVLQRNLKILSTTTSKLDIFQLYHVKKIRDCVGTGGMFFHDFLTSPFLTRSSFALFVHFVPLVLQFRMVTLFLGGRRHCRNQRSRRQRLSTTTHQRQVKNIFPK